MLSALMLLAGLTAAPQTAGFEWPKETLILMSTPTLLVLGDPGPGIKPAGESDDSQLKQSFYYHSNSVEKTTSMLLAEADCGIKGMWRVRASVDLQKDESGAWIMGNQTLAVRNTSWRKEEGDGNETSYNLGWAVWYNTCTGNARQGTKGSFTPWVGVSIWRDDVKSEK